MATPNPPPALLRRIGIPLVLYHALVLGGAALFLLGYAENSSLYEVIGVVLIVTGIGVQVAVLVWSAKLTRRAASAVPSAGDELEASLPEGPGGLCLRCARSIPRTNRTCPVCGGTVVSVPKFRS